jgi:glycosyltransferase involved in cell wall biosynthesis
MNVTVMSYHALSILHGGPSTQLRNTVAHMKNLGVNVTFHDPWKSVDSVSADLFHVFGANIGTYHAVRELHALRIPLMVSPIVFSLHSPMFVRSAIAATRMLQKFVRGVWTDYMFTADICSWAAMVLPNTEKEGELLTKGFGLRPERMRIVPNGVDERFLDADPSLFKKKYGMEKFILNVGHTGHGRKNVLRLIKALGQIDYPAVIIGRIIDNEYGKACVQEAEKHKHILLIDGLDNSSALLASAYAACDVFVLPSLFETPGIAALEAALTGAKVVITPYGGTEEYFGSMATYVDPFSVTSIRNGILRALGRSKDKLLSEHIKREYLWKEVARKTVEAYGEVMRGK